MKKIFFIVFTLLLLSNSLNAQFSIRLVVNDVATKNADDIYVAGNFNNWNPRDESYKLKPFGGGRKGVVVKDLPVGNYAFKFTRGSFDRVECQSDGRDIEDRIINIEADAIFECNIKGWKDNYPDKPKPYTATPQVKIMDTAFAIPQLNRKRRIWIYLPKGYASSNKTYPVLYMNDGQNLFNEQTASFGEWGVDEILDSMQKATGKECIIVGVDHGRNYRLSEYAPYSFETNKVKIKAEGKQYVDFLANTLKPYIDTKYRTKKTFENTFIAGSSMGGLISLYAVMQYPQVFGSAGVFSPSFWTAKDLFVDGAVFKNPNPINLYFYCGGKEGEQMIGDMNKMADVFANKLNIRIFRTVTQIGQHSEKYWHLEFPRFYEWLFKEY
jgi:metallo-beta-lactamase class B